MNTGNSGGGNSSSGYSGGHGGGEGGYGGGPGGSPAGDPAVPLRNLLAQNQEKLDEKLKFLSSQAQAIALANKGDGSSVNTTGSQNSSGNDGTGGDGSFGNGGIRSWSK